MAEIKALNCPNCGASIPDTSKACSHCGSSVILSDDRQKFVLAGTICPKCGVDNKEQHRFCSKCGENLFKGCPKCHREIGLDAIHCPFCGDNIDNAAKEKEIALAKYTDSLRQVELLQQKLKPLLDEHNKLSQQAGQVYRRIDYSDDRELSAANMFFLIYPIGALILSGIAYLMGLKSFFLILIVSYFGIFYIFYLWPSMKYKKLKAQLDLQTKELSGIHNEINNHNQIIFDVKNKYRI